MNTSVRRFVYSAVTLSVLSNAAQAHPGHDDGHEVTWEFRHLLAHPGATLSWLVLLGSALALGVWFARRSAVQRVQSLRGSQESRGQ